jgi:hypothetical protein
LSQFTDLHVHDSRLTRLQALALIEPGGTTDHFRNRRMQYLSDQIGLRPDVPWSGVVPFIALPPRIIHLAPRKIKSSPSL